MSFTRSERVAFEEVVKRIRKLEDALAALDGRIVVLEDSINRLNSAGGLENFSTSEWKKLLSPIVAELIKGLPINKHNHKNNQQGGSCFAKLGASLINNEGSV